MQNCFLIYLFGEDGGGGQSSQKPKLPFFGDDKREGTLGCLKLKNHEINPVAQVINQLSEPTEPTQPNTMMTLKDHDLMLAKQMRDGSSIVATTTNFSFDHVTDSEDGFKDRKQKQSKWWVDTGQCSDVSKSVNLSLKKFEAQTGGVLTETYAEEDLYKLQCQTPSCEEHWVLTVIPINELLGTHATCLLITEAESFSRGNKSALLAHPMAVTNPYHFPHPQPTPAPRLGPHIGGQGLIINQTVQEAFMAQKQLLVEVKQTQKPGIKKTEGRRSNFFNATIFMGSQVHKKIANASPSSQKIADEKLRVIPSELLKDDCYIRPAVLVELLQEQNVVWNCGSSRYPTGPESEDWSVAYGQIGLVGNESSTILRQKMTMAVLRQLGQIAPEDSQSNVSGCGRCPTALRLRGQKGFNKFTYKGWSMMGNDGMDDVTILVNSSSEKSMSLNLPFANKFSTVNNAILCVKTTMLLQNVPPAILLRFLPEHRSEWVDNNINTYSTAVIKVDPCSLPGSLIGNYSNRLIFPLVHIIAYEEFLEVIKSEGIGHSPKDALMVCEIFLLQPCSGMDENVIGTCAELTFTSIDGFFFSITTSVVPGVSKFASISSGSLHHAGHKILRLAKFFLGIGILRNAKDVYNQVDSLAHLERNKDFIPLMWPLPKIILSLAKTDSLDLKVNIVLVSATPPLTVKRVQAFSPASKDATVVHSLGVFPESVDVGNYVFIFELLVYDADNEKAYASRGQTCIPIYITTTIQVGNAEIAVLNSDLGNNKTMKKLELDRRNVSLSTNHLHNLHVSFELTTPRGQVFKPQQVFPQLRHETQVQHFFVVDNAEKKVEIVLDFLGLVEQLFYLSGKYDIQLTIDNVGMETSFLKVVGHVKLDLPLAPEKAAWPPPPPADPYSRYGPKAEITYVFRATEIIQ